MNNRRKVIFALGAAALGSPLTAYAQTKVWRVGFLSPRHVDFIESDNYYGPFRQGMRADGVE